jgi:hypothetical protein
MFQKPPLLPLYPKPKPMWLPKGKLMTIGIGFACDEGIVLATDSQETITDFAKDYRGKITTTFTQDYIASFAGAGSSDYIATAIEKAEACLRGSRKIGEMQKNLERGLLGFYIRHLRILPSEGRPVVELLIGVSTKEGGHGLFFYRDTSFYSVRQRAIGIGEVLAKSLMSSFYPENESLSTYASIASYVIARCKAQVVGCGGFTDLVALRYGMGFGATQPRAITLVEARFDGIRGEIDRTLQRLVTSQKVPISWVNENELKSLIKANANPFYSGRLRQLKQPKESA